MTRPHCCHVASFDSAGCAIGNGTPCEKDAEFEINDGPTPDDYTHACADHVGHMLQDGRISTVYPVEDNS